MRRSVIFAGSSHPQLAASICHRLGLNPAHVELRKFSNGETRVEIKSSVRDQDVFLVQSGSAEINDNVMELLIMINACKGGSARSITAVMPYFPYSRQSKRKTHRGAIAARMLANLMKVAGVDHVITIDLHASQMQGFFKCPVDNLTAQPILARWIRANIPDWQDAVVVSKNPGGTKRATSLADLLKLSFGIVTTERRRPNTIPNSMTNSVLLDGGAVLNGIGNGTEDTASLLREAVEAQVTILPAPDSEPKEQDFAHRPAAPATRSDSREHEAPRTATPTASTANSLPSRPHPTHGHSPQSSLSRNTRGDSVSAGAVANGLSRIRAVLGVGSNDTDGYEEAEGDDTDDQARDVITGRLISGHIVDDDTPTASQSNSSDAGLDQAQNGHAAGDDLPDPMASSLVSTASSRVRGGHGLGGTGDATASDEEEEEALCDPKIESTVTLVGNVRGRPVIIVDDMIDKAGSWIAAAETVVKRGGATRVYCLATHGLFGGNALRELQDCEQVDAIVVTAAFPVTDEKAKGITKLSILDVSGLLAEAIRRNHHGESISQLYHHLFD